MRPDRPAILRGLLGLLVQSVLLLPIPLLQGWVVDQLVAYCRPGAGGIAAAPAAPRAVTEIAAQNSARFAIASAIALGLGGTIGLHLVRAILAFKIAAMMGASVKKSSSPSAAPCIAN